jgi:hypothetical protein
MKKFIAISFALLILAIFVAVGVFWYLSVYSKIPLSLPSIPDKMLPQPDDSSTTAEDSRATASGEILPPVEEPAALTLPAEGIPLSKLPLTDAQKNSLKTVGVDVGTFVITKPMLECGIDKIGNDGVAALVEGKAPTFLEMTKLIPCLAE